MKLCLLVLAISVICAGQSAPVQIQDEHTRGVAQNPHDLAARLVIVGAKPNGPNDVELRILFTSSRPNTYTAELAPGGNAAAIEDFVFQGPGMEAPVHSKDVSLTPGIVCCGSNRHTIRKTPMAARSFLSLDILWERIPDPLTKKDSQTTLSQASPGDYWLFIQTRRVMRGWPKSEKDSYFKAGNLTVTSNNIVHFTILPDGSMERGDSSR
jgi:hypothetical protein